MNLAPASTASKARPFFSRKIFQATAFTGKPLSQVETTMGLVANNGLLLAMTRLSDSKGRLRADQRKNFLLVCIGYKL
jgi:hypothetical protein